MAVPECENCLIDEQGYYCSAHLHEDRILECPYDSINSAIKRCPNCKLEAPTTVSELNHILKSMHPEHHIVDAVAPEEKEIKERMDALTAQLAAEYKKLTEVQIQAMRDACKDKEFRNGDLIHNTANGTTFIYADETVEMLGDYPSVKLL